MWVAIWWMISVGRAVSFVVLVAIAVWEKGALVAVWGSMSFISESIISDESIGFDEVGGKCSMFFFQKMYPENENRLLSSPSQS